MKITIESDDGITTYTYDKVWGARTEEVRALYDAEGNAVARECIITFKQTLMRNEDEDF